MGKVLKVEKVGIYDNFFDWGTFVTCHQVMSRMRSAFSIDLPLRHMFESPTVAESADVITQSNEAGQRGRASADAGEVEATTEEDAEKLLVV
jgi:hypothetical protein